MASTSYEYTYKSRIGAVKTYYVLQKEDGSEFIAATKRALPVIRTLQATTIYEAQMKYWRQLKQGA